MANRFFYSLKDETNKVRVIKGYRFDARQRQSELKRIFLEDPFLNRELNDVRIAIDSTDFCYIPTPLFIEDKRAQYLALSANTHGTGLIQNKDLNGHELQQVFRLERDTLEAMQSFLPQSKIFHLHYPTLLKFGDHSRKGSTTQVYLSIFDETFQISVFQIGALLLDNKYGYLSEKDLVYFVLLIFDQLNLRQETTPLFLIGEITKDSKLYQAIFKYIRNVHFLQHDLTLDEGIQDEEQHRFYHLFALDQCE